MPAIWVYPWGLYNEGLETAIDDLAARGIDTLSVATHYHSVRSMQPRTPTNLFESHPGGSYFDPDLSYFEETPIKPIRNQIEGSNDPLDDICRVADEYGVSVNAWTVCLHNSRLGARYPDYQIEDAFGNTHEHAFCPSNGAVQEYFTAVARSLADYSVEEIELESVGFPSVFHGHDTSFGHDKRQVLTTSTEEVLFSQCFCDACQTEAANSTEVDVDMDAAERRIQSIIKKSFQTPNSDPLPLDASVQEYPELRALFDFRAEIVSDFVERIAVAAGDTKINGYFMTGYGVDPSDAWPAGIQLEDMERHLDRITAICYVNDPAVARNRLRTLKRATNLPINAAVTLDPETISSAEEFYDMIAAIKAELTGEIVVYHHTLATETQLDWVETAVND